jgi:ABC-type amino acid transport system permease subunit
MITDARTINPPIVGVPAFARWVFGASVFAASPIWCSFNLRMILGPSQNAMTSAVTAAAAARNVIYRMSPDPGM